MLLLCAGLRAGPARTKSCSTKRTGSFNRLLWLFSLLTLLCLRSPSNESQSLDAWSEGKKAGLCCFKLKERMYEFFGTGIFYCPSNFKNDSLDDEAVQAALEWLQELHRKRPLTEYKEIKDSEKEESELIVRWHIFARLVSPYPDFRFSHSRQPF